MEIDTDVAIIGGGAVGLCTAHALQTRGREVTVLERGTFEEGCSVGNAGLIVPSHVVPLAAPGAIREGLLWLLRRDSPFRIKPRIDLGLWHWLWRFFRASAEEHVKRSVPLLRDLNLKSRSIYEQWAREKEGKDFGFRDTGLLMLHKTEKGRNKDREEAKWAQEAGLEVSILDRDGVKEITPHVPTSVRGGVYYHQDALLNPHRLILALRRTLQQDGVSLRQGVSATGFDRQNGTVEAIRTTEGRCKAKDIVLAAGAWSSPLGKQLGIDVPVEPGKGYSVTYDVPEGRPEVPFILTEEKISVTPLEGRMRFAGTLELAGFDQSIDWNRVRPILDTAGEYVEGQSVEVEEQDVWVGFRPCTPDGLPIIGRVPSLDNVAVATGHSLMGVSLAAVTGQLVAEVLQGESSSIDLEPLQLNRFQ